MAQIQHTGVGGRAALAVLVEQDILCQPELVVQLIQGTQKHADAALIQERHLLRVLELDAGDIRPQLTAVQCGQQSVQGLEPLIRGRSGLAGCGAVRRRAARRRAGRSCLKFQLCTRRRGHRLAAAEDDKVRLGRILIQYLQPRREAQPAAGRLHGVDGSGRVGPHHYGVRVIPFHPDIFQQRELLFQRSGLFGGVEAEDVLLRVDAQRLQDLGAGIAAHLLHHLSIDRHF